MSHAEDLRVTSRAAVLSAVLLTVVLGARPAAAQLPTVFGPVATTVFNGTSAAAGFVPADLDLDGDVDFVTAQGGQPFLFTVLNDGGAYVLGPWIPVAPFPGRIESADIDHDGDPDFLTSSASTLSVVRVAGATVSRVDYPATLSTDGARFADLNGDGHPDIVVGVVEVRYGDGLGSFGAPVPLGLVSAVVPPIFLTPADHVAFADFDQDGDLDIVRAGGLGGGQHRIEVHLQSGGVFTQAFGETSGPFAFGGFAQVAVGDLDGDGDADIVAGAAADPDRLRTYRNSGGSIAPWETFGISPPAPAAANQGIAVGDIDADSDADVVTILRLSSFGPISNVFVLHGSPNGLVAAPSGNLNLTGSFAFPKLAPLNGNVLPDLVASTIVDIGGTLFGTLATFENLLTPGVSNPSHQLTFVAGAQSVMQGTAPLDAFGVLVVDGTTGLPAPGVVVQFSVDLLSQAAGLSLASATAVSDAFGIATVLPGPTPITTTPGSVLTVHAERPGAAAASTDLLTIGLRENLSFDPLAAATTYRLTFEYERAGLPLVLAVDAPLPAPGYVATPYGNLATTAVTPGPNLFVLDGIGAFGPPLLGVVTVHDPNYSASPGVWAIQATYADAQLAGLSLVFQVYAFDPLRPPGREAVISNALTRTF